MKNPIKDEASITLSSVLSLDLTVMVGGKAESGKSVESKCEVRMD